MGLLSLPDEVLLQIVELLSDNQRRPSGKWVHGRFRSPLLSLSLVCRRTNAVTEVHLYKYLQINFHYVKLREQKDSGTSFDVLLDALEKKPHRYAFIESLAIGMGAGTIYSDEKRQSLFRLLTESPNVKEFDLNCDEEALRHLPTLMVLDAKKIRNLQIGTAIVEELTKPGILQALRSLSISGEIKPDTNEDDWDEEAWWEVYELPTESRGISPLQYLNVTFDENHPCTVLPILSWIAALTHIRLDFVSHSNYQIENFTATQLQRILDLHSSTLEIITLNSYSYGEEPALDFRHFTNLRELNLSHRELLEDNSEDAARKLAAPKLVELTIDFDQEDQQAFVCESFEKYHSHWFKDFGRKYRCIIAEGGIREVCVINVHDENDGGYPILKETRAALKEMGIAFAWPGCFERFDDDVPETA